MSIGPGELAPTVVRELGRAAALAPAFGWRDCVSVGPSVDSLEAPSIADAERRMATLYGTLHPSTGDTATVRSMCVIGPDDRVKLTLTSLASTGRTCDEILRVLDSLQLTARHAVATPAVPDARDLRMTPPDR